MTLQTSRISESYNARSQATSANVSFNLPASYSPSSETRSYITIERMHHSVHPSPLKLV